MWDQCSAFRTRPVPGQFLPRREREGASPEAPLQGAQGDWSGTVGTGAAGTCPHRSALPPRQGAATEDAPEVPGQMGGCSFWCRKLPD